ncbi:hypothetical protein G8O24_35520 [Bradyrhizobium sp. INPA01-394B]|uniref:DUF680 domain-containing protein n=1 Tax=Bradyrhizobium campsiandrae TaxID=1729892 RepID=A0ABR7U1U5_9BRAD|nr:hypothetical protein [Bradyrhizobium campsiandrae]MBC9882619.1 hypothetical protein [Bradyrhizobium campsiandrae]MBC9977978.1 hypothetical protein [Bradyrhizobium campsiandrae]
MRNGRMIGLTLAALCAASGVAEARPPTVMNSPGYDARLQESRKAMGNPPAATTPTDVPARAPKHSKKKQKY